MNEMKIKTAINILCIFFISAVLFGCSSAVDSQTKVNTLFPDRYHWELKSLAIADADSKGLEFKRVDCVWVLGDENRATDEAKVTSLADKLVTLVPKYQVVQKNIDNSNPDAGNFDFSRKVTLTFKDGKSYLLLVGAVSDTGSVYVRLADKSEVYHIDEPLLRDISLDSSVWVVETEEIGSSPPVSARSFRPLTNSVVPGLLSLP